MNTAQIRGLVICLFSHHGRILASQGFDPGKQEHFYRPLGGRIEFGEYSQAALRREIREEIGAEISDLVYLGTLENIFTYQSEPGHEIVLVYDGAFVNPWYYQQDTIDGLEFADSGDERFTAVWVPISGLESPGSPPLYPDGLLALIHTHFNEVGNP